MLGVKRVDIHLFGRFSIDVGGSPIGRLDGQRVRELVAFLVINRRRDVGREALAATLWPQAAHGGRKNLRHVLWQLHCAVGPAAPTPVVVADHGNIMLDPDIDLCADLVALEDAHAELSRRGGSTLPAHVARAMSDAVAMYRGDLLEGSYDDWCLLERERYRTMYLDVVERLIAHAEDTDHLDEGIALGDLVLRHDRASERTHRRLMFMRYRSGDRTGAVRQYQSCVDALRSELDVAPGPATDAAFDLIRHGAPLPDHCDTDDPASIDRFGAALLLLEDLHATINEAQRLVEQAVAALVTPEADVWRRTTDA